MEKLKAVDGVLSFGVGDVPARELYALLIGAIAPRPIALVSTVSAAGVTNLAPFSFFSGVGSNPPALLFSTALKPPGGEPKDTLRNIRETREFVVAQVTEETVLRASQASFDYPPEVSEFAAAGFTPLPAARVRAPLVAESPVNFECELFQIVSTGDRPGAGQVIIGLIKHVHVREDALDAARIAEGALRPDPERLKLVGRMGGLNYCRTRDAFEVERPEGP